MRWRNKQKRIGDATTSVAPYMIIKCENGVANTTTVETSDGVRIPHICKITLSGDVDKVWEADIETVLPRLYLKAWLTDEARARMITECSQMLEWLVKGDEGPVYVGKEGRPISREQAIAEDADVSGE